MYSWSLIAGRLPGRTDNEVKNYWNTHLNKRCHRGKRKPTHSKEDQNNTITEEDTITNRNNKVRRLSNPPPVTSTETQEISTTDQRLVQEGTGKEEGNSKEEGRSMITNPWMMMGDTEVSFNYHIESPIMPVNNSTFVLDDEPFIAYMDSFLLFEAFGCSVREDGYAEVGAMQSIIP